MTVAAAAIAPFLIRKMTLQTVQRKTPREYRGVFLCASAQCLSYFAALSTDVRPIEIGFDGAQHTATRFLRSRFISGSSFNILIVDSKTIRAFSVFGLEIR